MNEKSPDYWNAPQPLLPKNKVLPVKLAFCVLLDVTIYINLKLRKLKIYSVKADSQLLYQKNPIPLYRQSDAVKAGLQWNAI